MLDCMLHTLSALDPVGETNMRDSIKIEPGCLDDVPISDMARFLAGHSLEMVATADGLKIRKARQPLDFPQHEASEHMHMEEA